MPNTFFTADTHFGHARIMELCGRPFADIRAHDEALIANWNALVAPEDVVWHVGDFAFGNPARIDDTLARLNGTKHLVAGNHDDEAVLTLPWATVSTIAETVVDGQRVALCHYPMKTWPKARKGSIHLFGHMHSSLSGTDRSLDVGVDCWDFRPVTLDQVRHRLRTLAPDPDFAEGRAHR